MNTILRTSITIDHATFSFVIQRIGDVSILNLDGKKGGFVFLKKSKESRWMKFAKWVDARILRRKPTKHPRQWVDISWFKNGRHLVRSYYFIALDRPEGKSDLAPHAASLALIHAFIQQEYRLPKMPDFIQVHYQSVFDKKNQDIIYGRITDTESGIEVISSFVVCNNMVNNKRTAQGNQVIH